MGIQINGQTDTVTATDGSINVGGDVTIPGVLTYEDVTNVDSVGIVTAQSGIHVTGGSVGIGTDNPQVDLHLHDSTNTRIQFTDDSIGGAAGDGVLMGLNGDDDFFINNRESSKNLLLFTENTERLRITSAGRMGLGTNDPAALLEVRDSENATKGVAQIRISKGVGNGAAPTSVSRADSYLHIGGSEYHTSFGKYNIAFGYTNDEVGSGIPAYIGFVETSLSGYTQGDLVFGTRGNTTGTDNPTERLRITSAGNIGIGTNNPFNATGYKSITLAGSTGGAIAFREGATTRWEIYGDNSNGIRFYDRTNTTERLRITSAGQLNLAGNMQFTAGTPELEFNNGGPRFRVPAANTLTIHTGGGLGATSNERLRIQPSGYVGIGEVAPGGKLTVKHANTSTSGLNATLKLKQGVATNGNRSSLIFSSLDDFDVAAVNGVVEVHSGTSANNVGRLEFWTKASGSNAAERVRISSAGNATFKYKVTIGDSYAGGEVLSIGKSSGTSYTAFHNGGANMGFIGYADQLISGGGSNDLGIRSQDDISFATGGNTEALRITSDGRVHIGDSIGNNHSGMFQVIHEGGGQQTNDCLAFFETNANDWIMKLNSNEGGSASHYHIYFMEEGSTRGAITGSHGSNVNYQQGSDYRWKENIIDLTGTEGIDICKRLRPRKYNWIKNREGTGQINTVDGFIAHEVQEAGVLGAVTGEKDAVNEDGSIDGQMLDYGQMTPVLAAAIKGLIAKVETLEAQVAVLEGS